MLDEVNDLQGALDVPSDKDFIAEHIFGADDNFLPKKLSLIQEGGMSMYAPHNQGKTMHCTAYALTHCVEILNYLEFQARAVADPEEQWANQKLNRGNRADMEKNGDSLQNALETLHKFGLNNKDRSEIEVEKFVIDSYAKIGNTVEDIKKWLGAGFPVYTGSGNHCYLIVGYNDDTKELQALNSFGPSWGQARNGTFTIGYSEISKLFSKYIVYDKRAVQMIFRDVSVESPAASAIKLMFQQGLMRGYNHTEGADPTTIFFKPNQPVTRAELATVLERLILRYNLH